MKDAAITTSAATIAILGDLLSSQVPALLKVRPHSCVSGCDALFEWKQIRDPEIRVHQLWSPSYSGFVRIRICSRRAVSCHTLLGIHVN